MSASTTGATSSDVVSPDNVSGKPRTSASASKSHWMADNLSHECCLCYRAFSLALRRHHCRSCGKLVCAKCSSKKAVLAQPTNDKKKGKKERVCDVCADELQAQGINVAGDSDNNNSNNKGKAVGVNVDHKMRLSALPDWTFAFKSHSTLGQEVGMGRLYVRVINAVNLPAMDFWGTSDPYVQVTLGSIANTKVSQKTAVKNRTTHPRWNEEFYFDVKNHTQLLYLDVMDWDQLGQDKPIGSVEIPLGSLAPKREIKWFDITLSEEAKDTYTQKKRDQRKQKMDQQKREHQIVSSAQQDAHKNESLTEIRLAQSRIQVEIQYSFNQTGEFFSHFNPEWKPYPPPPPFDIDVLYGQFFRFMGILSPIFWVLSYTGTVLFWTEPWLSFLVLVVYVTFCYQPWFFLVFCELLLIRYMVWQYVFHQWDDQVRREREYQAALRSRELAEKKKKRNILEKAGASFKSLLTKDENNNQLDAAQLAHLNTVVTSMLNSILGAAGMKQNLSWYQEMFAWQSDMLEWVIDLFSWRWPDTTRGLFYGVLGLTFYSCFFPQFYVYFLAGVYTLTMWTTPSMLFFGTIFGVLRFFNTTTKKEDTSLKPISEEELLQRASALNGTIAPPSLNESTDTKGTPQ